MSKRYVCAWLAIERTPTLFATAATPTTIASIHISPTKTQMQKHETSIKQTDHTTNPTHHRFSRSPDPRNDLFSSYNRSTSPSKTKNKGARSPYGAPSPGAGYGYSPSGSADHLAPNGGFSAYPGAPGGVGNGGIGAPGYRSATPNSRGQYSAQALEELESQNEDQVGVLTGKVKMLKDVSDLLLLLFYLAFLLSCSIFFHLYMYTCRTQPLPKKSYTRNNLPTSFLKRRNKKRNISDNKGQNSSQ